MKAFMDKDFLLNSETAITLYHKYAAKMPIVDYHCHISPAEIAEDRQFENVAQVTQSITGLTWNCNATLTAIYL